MDFCNNWELEEKARSFEMKTRLDQMDAMCNVQYGSKSKIDIFEAMNLLIFPYDPIRDYTKREVEKINERFKPIEDLIDFAYPYEIPKERGCAKLDKKGHIVELMYDFVGFEIFTDLIKILNSFPIMASETTRVP